MTSDLKKTQRMPQKNTGKTQDAFINRTINSPRMAAKSKGMRLIMLLTYHSLLNFFKNQFRVSIFSESVAAVSLCRQQVSSVIRNVPGDLLLSLGNLCLCTGIL